jgi:hypothetical protein
MSTYESLGAADPTSAIITGVTGLAQAGVALYNNIKTLEAQKSLSRDVTERLKIQAQIVSMKLEYARITGKSYEETDAQMGSTAKNVALIGGAAAVGLMALSQM